MMNLLLIFLSFISTVVQPPVSKTYMIVGTYTSKGKSQGIYVYDYDKKTGSTKLVSTILTDDPSYIALSPNKKFIYAVKEVMPGKVPALASFSFNETNGTLTYINEQGTNGAGPCYTAVDHTGKWAVAGNYGGGSFSIFPIKENGSLAPALSTMQHRGNGPNKDRQDKPHVHCTYFNEQNNKLYVPDLGIDKISVYDFNEKNGTATMQKPIETLAGAGPRHFIIHPNNKYAYYIEELGGHVVALQIDKDPYKQLQRISTLSKGDSSFAGSADIHISPDGNFLYASNRAEHNNIAIYKLDKKTGRLDFLQHQSTMGLTPRNFNIDPDGNFLLVANQNSDNIVVFSRNKKTGLLMDTGQRIPVGNPSCIKFITKP